MKRMQKCSLFFISDLLLVPTDCLPLVFTSNQQIRELIIFAAVDKFDEQQSK